MTEQTYVVGENGALSLSTLMSSSEDYIGSLCEIFLLTQDDSCVKEKVTTAWNLARGDKERIIQLMKMILFIREPRAGKGLRKVFYHAVLTLYKIDEAQSIAKSLISACSDFGYWGDLVSIWNMVEYAPTDLNMYIDLMKYIIGLYGEQLKLDFANTDGTNLSLAGKWAPREKSSNILFAKQLIRYLKLNYKEYRQQLSMLSSRLKTVESYMCAKKWKDIDFGRVPSVAMTSLSNAFQDIKVNSYPKQMRKNNRRNTYTRQNLRRHEQDHPDYEDREACRINLMNHIASGKKINSAVTNLSKIVENYLSGQPLNEVWETQWTSRVNELKALATDLDIFPMIDLSGSMNGEPMINAITLGIFTSSILDHDLDKPESVYANRFMTFAGQPQIVRLPRNATLYDKIQIIKKYQQGCYWGNNTNISLAMDMLLSVMSFIGGSSNGGSMPKYLAIFSDMQFDAGDASWNQTSYENIRTKFNNAGVEVPHIIFWNLRSNLSGYQVSATQPNSTCLSGFSTRMMDLFLSGSIDELKTVVSTDNTKTDANTVSLVMKVFEHKMFEDCKKNIFECVSN